MLKWQTQVKGAVRQIKQLQTFDVFNILRPCNVKMYLSNAALLLSRKSAEPDSSLDILTFVIPKNVGKDEKYMMYDFVIVHNLLQNTISTPLISVQSNFCKRNFGLTQ